MMLGDPHTPHYCSACGEELKYYQVDKGGKQVIRVVCSRCGDVGSCFSAPLSSEDMADLMFLDKDQLPSSLTSAMIFGLTPPPPPPPPPLPSQFIALGQELEAYGFGVIVMAAHFPLFALADLEERFFPGDLSYAGGRHG